VIPGLAARYRIGSKPLAALLLKAALPSVEPLLIRSQCTWACGQPRSIHFRIRPTLFNEVWSLLHHRTWFYTDYVAAAVPPVVSKCEAVTYGVRVKLFVRGLNIYPDLIDVSCQPLMNK
jgi:hypothetical protein